MAIEKIVNITVNNNIDDTTSDIKKLNTSLDNTTSEVDNLDKSLGKVGDKKSVFGGMQEGLSKLVPAINGSVSAMGTMLKAMWALVANPIGLVLGAIVGAVALLVAAFRTFQPLVDKLEQGFAALSAVINVVKNTFIAVVTGTKSLGDALSGLGDDISSTAKRTMALVKAQQTLEDIMKSQEVATAKQRAEINKLNVQAKNRNLTDSERLELLNKAERIEKKLFDQRVKLADEEVRIAREAIAIKAQFTKEEIELLKKTGDATKELAESRGGNYDEEYDNLNKARIARIALEDESTANLEKNFNKQEALAQRQEEARQKRIDDEKERQEKLKAERDANLKAANDFQIAVNNAEFAQRELELENEQRQIDELNTIKDKAAAEDEARRKKDLEDEMAVAQAKKEIQEATISTISNGIGLLKQIAGKNKALQTAALIADSAIGIAKIIINTQTANAAAVAKYALIPGGQELAASEIILNKVNAGIGIASNLIATKTAISALGGGGSPNAPNQGGGQSGGGSTPPQFNVVGQSGTNQLAASIGQQQNQPIKAYVVSGDVTTAQQMDRNTINTASFP